MAYKMRCLLGRSTGTDGRHYFQAGAICIPGQIFFGIFHSAIWADPEHVQVLGECSTRLVCRWMKFTSQEVFHNVGEISRKRPESGLNFPPTGQVIPVIGKPWHWCEGTMTCWWLDLS